eukprot:TRINITY_DN738_c0_g5_i1.p1 TRINITY_DN738_c0_g5~~TRINITY_DN738_c0_g5_i1.p1  ORF type:complete len:481 (+),score=88.68 TRINITY_DN738_c0_g5_i1:324-1766(+)
MINSDNGIEIDNKLAFYILSHHDKDQDGKLSFKEFLSLVLPLNNSELRVQVTQKELCKVQKALPASVKRALVKVIYKEALMHKKVERIKYSVVARRDFNLIEAFKAIDCNHARFIGFENLEFYLRRNGAVFQEEDVVAFIQRYDRDLDCKLSYMEFMDAILPFDCKGKERHSYSDPTETSILRASKASSSPFKSSLKEVKGNGSECTSSKLVQRTASKLGHCKLNSESSKKVKKSVLITPSKSIQDKKERYKGLTGVSKFEPAKSPEGIKKPITDPAFESYLQSDTEEFPQYVALMQNQIIAEKSLEALKQSIALKGDIALPSLCKLFNPDNVSYITPLEFLEGFQRFSIMPTHAEVYMVFDRLDDNMDGKLSCKDLCRLFVPRQEEYACLLLGRSSEDKRMSKESFEMVRRLLEKYVEVEERNKEWKRRISGREHRTAFEQCDTRGRGFFDITDVLHSLNLGRKVLAKHITTRTPPSHC